MTDWKQQIGYQVKPPTSRELHRRRERKQRKTQEAAGPERGYWNGLPTGVQRGTAVVADAPQFPQYWAKTEGIVGRRIPVVLVVLDGVNAGGGTSYLDDRDGSGWRKVTAGHGSPSYGHRDVVIAPGSFEAEGGPADDQR